MADQKDFIVPDDFIMRMLVQMPGLPAATQAGMSTAPPTKPAMMDWLSVLASMMGLALPGRGGMGEPWRMQPARAEDLQRYYNTSSGALRQVDQNPLPTAKSFGQEFAPPSLEQSTPASVFAGKTPQFADTFKDYGGVMEGASKADETRGLWDMILRYIMSTSRQ